MDIEMAEDLGTPSTSYQSTRSQKVMVDEAHPFELDSYISNYSGRLAIDRLIYVVTSCPPVASEAFQLALQHIYQGRDPSLYQALVSAYDHASVDARRSDIPPLDTKWVEEIMSKNMQERTKLEAELKTYTNNMIKESIRMGHRDLGDFFRATGDYSSAMKHYTKSREFCTTSQHVLDMCLSVLELLIEQRNYTHIPTYVFKAEAALDAAAAAANNATKDPTAPTTTPATAKKPFAEKDKIQSKLDFATALGHLGSGNYEKAAYHFTRLGSPKDFGDWLGKIVAPGDIAIYGTICALASMTRSGFKAQVMGSTTFGIYIEQEQYIRELVEAHMGSNFKTVLDVLNKYSTRHFVDIHLAPHVHDLMNLIRNKALVLYFQPFSSIRLERMSAAFGWTLNEVEHHVVALIQSGDIQGRVDSQNKILQVKKTDYRADLFAKAIKAGEEMQAANRKLLLRMRLQQADLIIKAPKGHISSSDFGTQD
ncbi:26S proteasome subunit RPN7-domain-containing protein [Mycena floridula]|nr:26S proteasome subunit RPN7-domain-containing protein [Mycena floridula]